MRKGNTSFLNINANALKTSLIPWTDLTFNGHNNPLSNPHKHVIAYHLCLSRQNCLLQLGKLLFEVLPILFSGLSASSCEQMSYAQQIRLVRRRPNWSVSALWREGWRKSCLQGSISVGRGRVRPRMWAPAYGELASELRRAGVAFRWKRAD